MSWVLNWNLVATGPSFYNLQKWKISFIQLIYSNKYKVLGWGVSAVPSPIPPILGVLVEFFPLLTGCYWKFFFSYSSFLFHTYFFQHLESQLFTGMFSFFPQILDQMHLLGQKQILINCILSHVFHLNEMKKYILLFSTHHISGDSPVLLDFKEKNK